MSIYEVSLIYVNQNACIVIVIYLIYHPSLYLREHPGLLKLNPLSHTHIRFAKIQFPLGVQFTVIFVDLPSFEIVFFGHVTTLLIFAVDEFT